MITEALAGMARILMVDDDEMERIYAAEVLRWGGHEPVFAQDGTSAIKIFSDGNVDLVITDLAMPRKDGLELIREIRRENSEIPIVAISGKSPQQLAEAEELGAQASFAKPWDARELVDTIDRLLTTTDEPGEPVIDDSTWYD